jgi:hypothetical protein
LTEIRAILWHLFLPCRAIPDDHRAEVFFRRVEVKNYRGVSPFGSRLAVVAGVASPNLCAIFPEGELWPKALRQLNRRGRDSCAVWVYWIPR